MLFENIEQIRIQWCKTKSIILLLLSHFYIIIIIIIIKGSQPIK